MTNHLRAIDIKEYAKALDVAKEFADRAEKAEAAIQRVREACANGYPDAQYPDFDGGYQTACEDILRALDGDA